VAGRDGLLLRLLAAVFAAQFGIYVIGAGSCIYVGVMRQQAVCQGFDANLQRTFETAMNTILALMGGAALQR
jgi:hypothetical protein